MKKKVFWLAAMAVTVSMASCSLEEVVEQPTPQAIGFSSFVGKPTKAVTQTEKTNLGSFQVYGGYDGNTVFNGVSVTSGDNGTSWSYDDTQYWVPGQDYKFAAMGPTDALTGKGTLSFNYGTGHLTLQDYTEANLEDSKDIVYVGNVSRTTNNPLQAQDYVDVPFTFGHIMSWIKIKFVHKMTTGYKITVSDVTVTGVKTGATFAGTGTSTGTWSTPLSSDAAFSNQTPANNELTTADASCLVDFIAIPQTVGTLTIGFKLTVVDSADNTLIDGKAMSSTVSSAEWASNNIYVYTANLEYGKVGIYPIQFTVEDFSWDDTTNNSDLIIQ